MTSFEEGRLRSRIAEQFEGTEYLGTVEIRAINDFVFIDEKSQPYFRLHAYLTGDPSMDAGDIGRRLKALNIEIEMHDLR